LADLSLRIDKLLWYLRLTKSRSAAQALIASGRVRINSIRVEKLSADVKLADILTIPRGEDVLVIRILSLPHRRGPAIEAQACYAEI
jgi:ribosome-associated heat shock protein Hsp15